MPRILVSMYLQPEEDRLCLRRDHIRRLRRSGALPLLLPHIDEPISGELAREYLAGCHGLLLTGGGDIEPRLYGREPGPDTFVDPARDQAEIALTRAAWEMMLPVFGICLGHQLAALALGGDTIKLKYGHRGGNQPVRDLAAGRTYITSQNHGYAVVADSLKGIGTESFRNANDGSCEGMDYPDLKCFTVQFHPEAASGPRDTAILFDRFVENMTNGGKTNA